MVIWQVVQEGAVRERGGGGGGGGGRSSHNEV